MIPSTTSWMFTEDIDPESIEIPAMVVQPYVEKAIKHGAPSQEGQSTSPHPI